MSMKIILAIIAFNIVMGMWAKRKKKQQEEADKGGGVDAKEEARQRIEGMRARDEAAQARAQSERETRDGRDDGESAARAANQAKKEKAVDVGKDILGQLAKELGLELPQPQAPRPAPRPQPAQAAPAQAAKAKAVKAKAARAIESSTPRPSAGRMAHDENVREADARAARRAQSEHSSGEEGVRSLKDLLAAQKAASSREGENAPRRGKTDHDDAPVGARVAGPMIRREEIIDPAAMRRAFVLQTILEKPLSLRRSEGK